jgi:hypothetical protein
VITELVKSPDDALGQVLEEQLIRAEFDPIQKLISSGLSFMLGAVLLLLVGNEFRKRIKKYRAGRWNLLQVVGPLSS